MVEAGTRLLLRRILSLTVGCLCCLVAGLAISLPIFVNTIKDTFGLMQTDIEILIAMFSLGAGIMILPGIVLDKFGHRVTNCVGGTLVCTGLALVLSSTYYPNNYQHQSGLLTAYFFLAGHGTAYIYMSAMAVNMLNFPPKHRGKIMMILDSFYSCSAIFFAPIYFQCFANGHFKDLTKQDLDGFFVFLLSISAVASISSIFIMPTVQYDGQEEEEDAVEMMDAEEEEECKPILEHDHKEDQKCPMPRMNKDFLANLTSLNFQLMMWTTAIIGAICNVILGNTTAMSRSLKINNQDMYLSFGPALFGVLVHLVLGPSSDLLVGVPGARSGLLLATGVGVLMSEVLLVIFTNFNNALPMLLTALSLAQMGQGGISLSYVIYSESFAKAHLGKLIGISLLIQNLLGLLLQTFYGAIYDSRAQAHMEALPNTNNGTGNQSDTKPTCYGPECFSYGLISDLVLSCVAVVTNLVYIIRVRQLRQRRASLVSQ